MFSTIRRKRSSLCRRVSRTPPPGRGASREESGIERPMLVASDQLEKLMGYAHRLSRSYDRRGTEALLVDRRTLITRGGMAVLGLRPGGCATRPSASAAGAT